MRYKDFTPVSVKEGKRELSGPFEGVPDHLFPSLKDWLVPIFYRSQTGTMGSTVYKFEYGLLREAERCLAFPGNIDSENSDLGAKIEFENFLHINRDICLDVADFVLWKGLGSLGNGDLNAILYQAGSVYKVADTTGSARLERRVEKHTEQLAKETMNTNDSASELLSQAWSATYGLKPAPSEGYRCAVRAVEAIAGPLILPNDPKVTLGKIIDHLQKTRDQWEFALPNRQDNEPSVQTVIDCLGSLWTSQYDRHVSEDMPLHVQPQETDAAVPLAAITVHWLQNGLLGKNKGETSPTSITPNTKGSRYE